MLYMESLFALFAKLGAACLALIHEHFAVLYPKQHSGIAHGIDYV